MFPTLKEYRIEKGVHIVRSVGLGSHPFNEIFQGFDKLEAVEEIFGKDAKKVLSDLRVEVFDRRGFMGVSDEDGHIFASKHYILEGELWSIYLDVIHELVHVRQFMEGKELFDERYAYVDRPTELEAYRLTVREARRIGLSEEEIFEYLLVPWISEEEHKRLAASSGVKLTTIPKT
jgi:hypothetical protein